MANNSGSETLVADAGAVHSIMPTRTYNLFDGAVTVYAFGRPINYKKLAENPRAADIITAYAAHHGVTDIFAPRGTEKNALVIDADPQLFLEKTVQVRSVWIHWGPFVDAVRLVKPRTALFIASADCPTLVSLFEDGSVVGAHCARDSLIDRHMVEHGELGRRHYGIVQAIFDGEGKNPSRAQVALVCGIGPRSFEHRETDPKHGSRNTRLIDHLIAKCGERAICNPADGDGRLDMFEIIKALVAECQVPVDNGGFEYDGIDTFADEGPNGYVWHSHKRGDKETRNGILVIRHR